MGVIGKQRDQGKEQGGKDPEHGTVQANYRGISEITGNDLGRQPGAGALIGAVDQLFGCVMKSVRLVQILDAFSSAPAGGGDQPGSPGCWGRSRRPI